MATADTIVPYKKNKTKFTIVHWFWFFHWSSSPSMSKSLLCPHKHVPSDGSLTVYGTVPCRYHQTVAPPQLPSNKIIPARVTATLWYWIHWFSWLSKVRFIDQRTSLVYIFMRWVALSVVLSLTGGEENLKEHFFLLVRMIKIKIPCWQYMYVQTWAGSGRDPRLSQLSYAACFSLTLSVVWHRSWWYWWLQSYCEGPDVHWTRDIVSGSHQWCEVPL